MPQPDRAAEVPKTILPLDYAEVKSDPRKWVVLPVLGGLVIGFAGAGCLGAVLFTGLRTGGDRGGIIVFGLLALLMVVLLFKNLAHRTRDWSFWFALGLLIGAGTATLIDGVCFMVAVQ